MIVRRGVFDTTCLTLSQNLLHSDIEYLVLRARSKIIGCADNLMPECWCTGRDSEL